MGVTNNPHAPSSGGVSFAPHLWPAVPEALLKFVQTMHNAILPGPPLNPDVMMEVLNEMQLPAPPAAPEPVQPKMGRKDNKSRRKGNNDAGSDEDEDEPNPLAASGEDVFKSRQAAKLRRKT